MPDSSVFSGRTVHKHTLMFPMNILNLFACVYSRNSDIAELRKHPELPHPSHAQYHQYLPVYVLLEVSLLCFGLLEIFHALNALG